MILHNIAAVALAALVSAPVARAQGLVPTGYFTWVTEAVTELSGIEMDSNGLNFTAVSDRGWLIRGQFERQGGRIAGITVQEITPIQGNDGFPVAARRIGDWADAEGLAMASNGGCWIAFERWAHVAYYDLCSGAGNWIRDHPQFAELPVNRQLEALAVSPDDLLYTIAEAPQEDGFPVWRLKDGTWAAAGHIPDEGGFTVTGADFDEAGWLFLVERKLIMGLWWQSRIRRLRISDPDSIKTLWTGNMGEYGNLEGIAVWRDGTHLRLTLVTDDNGNPEEPTTFVEFVLEEAS